MNVNEPNNPHDVIEDWADAAPVFFAELLFSEPVKRPAMTKVDKKIEEAICKTDFCYESDEMCMFYIYCNHKDLSNDNQKHIGLCYFDVRSFDPSAVSTKECKYCNCEKNIDEILKKCSYKLMLGDMMNINLENQMRCEYLLDWINILLECYPQCVALHFPTTGKVISAEEWRAKSVSVQDFLYNTMALRIFAVEGKKDEFIADTLGMYYFNLPDIQCHFHSMDSEKVIWNLFLLASAIMRSGDVIVDGESVRGIFEGSLWTCRHENSLVKPHRIVLDINAGEFASGLRE